MKSKIKVCGRILAFVMTGLLLCGICLMNANMAVKAEENNFKISLSVRQSDRNAYDIQITLENFGADWEGTARLFLHDTYTSEGDAYDTELSLPQGSTKQFAVKVPVDSITSNTTAGKVVLLDKKNQSVADKEFFQIFRGEEECLSMGILSDSYADLTYLDMGGMELDYALNDKAYDTYPIKLAQMERDNLQESLDTLNFLVIDDYNTSVLPDEALNSIQAWVDNGGVLLVGTGGSAEDTLSGLDYLDVKCEGIYAPQKEEEKDGASEGGTEGEPLEGDITGEALEDGTADGNWTEATYEYWEERIIDESQLSVAELSYDKNDYNKDIYNTQCLRKGQGNGAVGILPYSLAEIGSLGESVYQYSSYNKEDFVYDLLNSVSSDASSRYNNNKGYYTNNMKYDLRTMLAFLGNGATRLQYGGLKLIVIVYVIFAGPVLYLILRTLKKQDFYWLAVPAAAFVGVLLVYFAGRGFEVASTRVYSVTVENLGGAEKTRTYLHCYDAGHREWNLRLAEGYECAGPLAQTRYGNNSEDKYYYHIRKDGDRLFAGMNPTTGFEDSFFMADKAKASENAGISADIHMSNWNMKGQVVNETGYDFKYFAVILNGELYLYEDLAAGESCMVEDKKILYNSAGDFVDRYLYNWLGRIETTEQKEDSDILTALGIGLCRVYPELDADDDETAVVGVIENWDKAVDDSCSETSYGCFYIIQ